MKGCLIFISASSRAGGRVSRASLYMPAMRSFRISGGGNTIPDEIESAFARPQVVVEAGDRVGDDLLLFGQIEREQRVDTVEGLRREIGFVRCAAPDVIAGINGLHV